MDIGCGGGLLSEPMAIQVARSTGQTTARLAEWQIDTFLEHLTSGVEPGLTRAEVAYPLVELLLPELEQFLVYVWRRQLAAVTGRVVQAAEDEDMQSGRLAVGFADLVGFTRLSRRLEEEELGELVENFEISCADIVAGSAHNGSAGIDVATMEVYGKPVSRSGTVQSELSK